MFYPLVAFYLVVAYFIMSLAAYVRNIDDYSLLLLTLMTGGGAIGLARMIKSQVSRYLRAQEGPRDNWVLRIILLSAAVFTVSCVLFAGLGWTGSLFESGGAVDWAIGAAILTLLLSFALPLAVDFVLKVRSRYNS